MGDTLDPILFDDALAPEQREAFRAALAADPELAATYARWQAVRAAVRDSLTAHIPNRHLLVLYALDTSDHADRLSAHERQALDAVRPSLDAAIAAHPALAHVLRRIREDADVFDATWRDMVDKPAVMPPRTAPDRLPRRAALRPVRTWAWRAAAVFAVTVFAFALANRFQTDRGTVTLATDSGEVRLVELADGSTVRLLGNSSIAYADGDFDRHVRLHGKAFFDIVKDGKAFTVETPTAFTTVLGTTFGVRADADATEVVLVNGSVSLATRTDRDQFVVLNPGEMSRVAGTAAPSAPRSVDVSAALDWQGLFVFRATPLAEAIARLSRHYGARVTLAEGLAADSVSGTFGQDESLEAILQTLAVTLSADVQRADNGGYVLLPAASNN